MHTPLRIGLVSISDRASSVYRDKGIPALEEWAVSALTTPSRSNGAYPDETGNYRANVV